MCTRRIFLDGYKKEEIKDSELDLSLKCGEFFLFKKKEYYITGIDIYCFSKGIVQTIELSSAKREQIAHN